MGPLTIPLSDDFQRGYPASAPNAEEQLIMAGEASPDDDLSEYDWDLDLLPLLDQIPAREADVLELHLRFHKRQESIAKIFHMTQAAVSYMISRATSRLKFLLSRPKVTEEELQGLLAPHLSSITVECMVGIFFEGSQQVAGEKLGFGQGRIRHRSLSGIARLALVDDPKVKEVYTFFQKMIDLKQWNLIHRVRTADRWAARKGIDEPEVEKLNYTAEIQYFGGECAAYGGEEPAPTPPLSEVRVRPAQVGPITSRLQKEPNTPKILPVQEPKNPNGSGTWKAELDDFLRAHPWSEIHPLLAQLPGSDGKLVELVHQGRDLTTTAQIIGMTRSGLFTATRRVVERMDFLLRRPTYSEDHLRELLANHFSASTVNGLVVLYKFNSREPCLLSKLGIPLSSVRLASEKSPPKLEQIEDPELKPFCEFILWMIKGQHWNLLRKGPQGGNWRGRIKEQSQDQLASA